MAYFQGSFWSEILEMETNLCVIIPDERLKKGERGKTLYLLHGYGGTATSWLRSSNIEALANKYHLAVVMPEVGYSYYQDMVYGKKYFTYLTKELPVYMENLFPISRCGKDRYVIGCSMGGYGALRCVLSLPENYAAGAGIASVPDINWLKNPVLFNFSEKDGPYVGYENRRKEAAAILGTIPEITPQQDLYYLAQQMSASQSKSKVISICGTSDGLLSENQKLAEYLNELKINFIFKTLEGKHDSELFQKGLALALELIFDSEEE